MTELEHCAIERIIRNTVNNQYFKMAYIRGLEKEDLIQECYLRVYTAIRRFDNSRGTSFEAFVIRHTNGAILDARRKYGVASRRYRENVTKGISPPVTFFPLSDDIPSVTVNKMDNNVLINELLEISFLNKRQRFVIKGILAGKTEKDLSEEIGVSESRVSQIYTECVKKLRKKYMQSMNK